MRAVIAVMFLAAAPCVSGYEPERARANLAHELAECGAWFTLIAESPGLDAVARIKFRAAGLSLASSSADITSEEWAIARMELASKAMRRDMGDSWKNFSVLNNKYGQLCRDLASDPAARRRYWLDKRN